MYKYYLSKIQTYNPKDYFYSTIKAHLKHILMAKVLIIRKTDKSIHQVPVVNKAALIAYSNRSNLGWKFEEMDEEEAAELPFIDLEYVTPSEAQSKLPETLKENEDLKAKLAELESKLAAQSVPVVTVPPVMPPAPLAELVIPPVKDEKPNKK